MTPTITALLLFLCPSVDLNAVPPDQGVAAYEAGPFAFLSKNYFERFSHDTKASPATGEMAIDQGWQILVPPDAVPLTTIMAGHFAEFLGERMGLDLPIRELEAGSTPHRHAIVLEDNSEVPHVVASGYGLLVSEEKIIVRGKNPEGLRDGIVHLVDQMGFRAAPILEVGAFAATPRLSLRVGAVPWMGSYRDVVFLGNNAVILTAGVDTRKKAHTRFAALSTSDAIEELVSFQDPALLNRMAENARQARRYGLKTFAALRMWDAYPADAPIFDNHPGLRGAEILHFVNKPPVGFIPCSEHPLMRRYLEESVQSLFRNIPLDGILIIIGGENFQHCFMRSADVEKGHTNCERCEKLGAETVVANMCNYMAEAARKVNPDAYLVAWPYSASYFWSSDDDQVAFINKLEPGTAILTEIEKDETITKDGGVRKLIWDYSIDNIGPTQRAQRQIAACKARGIEVFLKSEPELAFEAPGLPYIPCLDRWYDRAEALAFSGADGAWVFPWFQACYGTTSAEVYKFAWWEPSLGKDVVMRQLAHRLAGPEAADHLRRAWAHVSKAIPFSPEQPPYFCGPYYLGPAHPMFANPNATLPEFFQAQGRFGAHVLTMPRGDIKAFGSLYRGMEAALQEAVNEIEMAEPLVPERCRLTFQAEALPTRWFYHTARTHANFYESHQLRESVLGFASKELKTPEETIQVQAQYNRWRQVLTDERGNTAAAITVVEADPRLDVRNGMGKKLAPAVEMMRAKLDLLDNELNVYLPSIARNYGLDPGTPKT